MKKLLLLLCITVISIKALSIQELLNQETYQQKKRRTFDLLNKEDIYNRYPDLDKAIIDNAFKCYKNHPVGPLPETEDRIVQLDKAWVKQQNVRKTRQTQSREALQELEEKKEAISKKYPHLTQRTIDAAFNYRRHNPQGELPEIEKCIIELAAKWDIVLAQSRERVRIKRATKPSPARKKGID